MLRRLFERLVGQNPHLRSGAGPSRLSFDTTPAAIYAIGDVHGCLGLLKLLEAQIVEDAKSLPDEGWIVMLGDVIDRGDRSAQVIDHLLAPPPAGLKRLCLMGNHEAMMLDFIRRPSANAIWLENGGRETLLSYGVPIEALMHDRFGGRRARQIVDSYIPDDHLRYLESLPLLIETPAAIFVHAGLDPEVPLDRQRDADLINYRDDYASGFERFGKPVVHGHSVREEPLVTPGRIAIDTGAFFSGRLTAVRLMPGEPPRLFSTPTNRPQQTWGRSN